VVQDPPNDRGVVDQRDQLEASPTARTGEDIQAQAAAHQLRPEIVASVATVRRLGVRSGGLAGLGAGGGPNGGAELDDE